MRIADWLLFTDFSSVVVDFLNKVSIKNIKFILNVLN